MQISWFSPLPLALIIILVNSRKRHGVGRRVSAVILKLLLYYYGFAPTKRAQWTAANYHNLRGVMRPP